MKVEQFVVAYKVEQDRLRALLPNEFESLRPVLRINAEIRDNSTAYLELNTPVSGRRKRGWLNIGSWEGFSFEKKGKTTVFSSEFLTISFTAVGIEGACPAEKDNDGCFFTGENACFRPAEKITVNKEFCDCEFEWSFTDSDARGKSEGKTIPAFSEPPAKEYEKQELTAQNAAAIPCQQVLGSYTVKFER